MITKPQTLAMIALFMLASCTKKEETTTGAVASVTAAPAAVVVAPSSSVDEDDPSIVTTEDLADQANQEISATNLEEQLDGLEKEIGSSE